MNFDISFCKLMLGVVGLSATVAAVHHFAKNKTKQSDNTNINSVAKNNKSSCPNREISIDQELTTENKNDNLCKKLPKKSSSCSSDTPDPVCFGPDGDSCNNQKFDEQSHGILSSEKYVSGSAFSASNKSENGCNDENNKNNQT